MTLIARSELASLLQGVPGWLSLDEAYALHDAVVRAALRSPEINVVEIGSWKGRSTIALGAALRACAGGRFFAIDPHHGSEEHVNVWGRVDTYQEFLTNIRRGGVSDVVTPLRMTSHEARAVVGELPIHVLFVDGSHKFEDVLQDIGDWSALLTDGATVGFNDPGWPGVNRALRLRVARWGSPYHSAHAVGNTLFFTLRRHAPWALRDALELPRTRAYLAAAAFGQRMRSWLPHPVVHVGHIAVRRLLAQ